MMFGLAGYEGQSLARSNQLHRRAEGSVGRRGLLRVVGRRTARLVPGARGLQSVPVEGGPASKQAKIDRRSYHLEKGEYLADEM